MMARRGVVLFGALFALAACGDDDAGMDDGGIDSAIGTDAGQGFHQRPPYPCHYYMHGAGRYGLQCLTNLDLLPPTGAVVIAPPLKIRQGSGSPLRVIALVAGA